MARVALGGSLRSSVQVRKGAAWYAHNLFCSPWNPHRCSHRRPPLSSGRHVSPSCRVDSGLRETFITGPYVPFLLTTM
jgi:hypothetical protein